MDVAVAIARARQRYPDIDVVVADNLRCTAYELDLDSDPPTIYLNGDLVVGPTGRAVAAACDEISGQTDRAQVDPLKVITLLRPGCRPAAARRSEPATGRNGYPAPPVSDQA